MRITVSHDIATPFRTINAAATAYAAKTGLVKLKWSI
jgi:hypothetical protein